MLPCFIQFQSIEPPIATRGIVTDGAMSQSSGAKLSKKEQGPLPLFAFFAGANGRVVDDRIRLNFACFLEAQKNQESTSGTLKYYQILAQKG